MFDHSLFLIMGIASSVLFMNNYYWFCYLPDVLFRFGIQIDDMSIKIVSIILTCITSCIVWILGRDIKKTIENKLFYSNGKS